MQISLKPITRDNFDDVSELKIHDHQRDYVSSNLYSIAQASLYKASRTRAIYLNERPIGFIMYCTPEEGDEEPGDYGIWRFMIDASEQGKGYGFESFKLALSEICDLGDVKRIIVAYKAENLVAKRFYERFGFQEIGLDGDSGEVIAVVLSEMLRNRVFCGPCT